MAAKRSHVLQLMRGAFRRGQSATGFVWDMRQRGLGYRRTDMLSDWRTINQLEKKKGLMRFIRKDYYPARQQMAEVEWALDKEYAYRIRVHQRLTPDAPITERFVQIGSDNPLTSAMVEQALIEKWAEWEYEPFETVTDLQVWTAVHRAAI